jgi:hypothetical protein
MNVSMGEPMTVYKYVISSSVDSTFHMIRITVVERSCAPLGPAGPVVAASVEPSLELQSWQHAGSGTNLEVPSLLIMRAVRVLRH